MDMQGRPDGVRSVSCGCAHTLALVGGYLVTFGRGEDGQLGHGDVQDCCLPKIVANMPPTFSAVACGAEYSVAISDGVVFSWGWGDFGRLGHGGNQDSFVPRPITSLQSVYIVSVSCGDTHTLLVSDRGEVYACGRNMNGQLGLGHTDDSLSPQLVTSLQGKRVISTSCGAEHSLAVTDSGELYSWGWGRYGNLGDGDTVDRLAPTRVEALCGRHITGAACGWRHSIAVDRSGDLYTFGWCRYGQLGHGDYRDQLLPKKLQSLSSMGISIREVAGGWRHTMAADTEGNLYGWGWNKFGQLGVGHTSDCVCPVGIGLGGERVVKVACGWRHSVALTATGKFLAWGRGANGQLGLGGIQDVYTPHVVLSLSHGSIDVHTMQYSTSPSGTPCVPVTERYGAVPDKFMHTTRLPAVARVPDVGHSACSYVGAKRLEDQ